MPPDCRLRGSYVAEFLSVWHSRSHCNVRPTPVKPISLLTLYNYRYITYGASQGDQRLRLACVRELHPG